MPARPTLADFFDLRFDRTRNHCYQSAQMLEPYVPAAHIQRDYEFARQHRWYDAPRAVTVNDLYAFDQNAKVGIDPVGTHVAKPGESGRAAVTDEAAR